MLRPMLLAGLLGVAGATAGCRHHNPNYKLTRAPGRPLDGYTALVIGPIQAQGRWDAKLDDEAQRCAQVVAERARDYVAGRGVFGEVKLGEAEAGESSLFVRGGITQLNPGSRGGRIASSIIFGRDYGQGYVEIEFDVHESGPDGGLLMSGICFSRVRGTAGDPMAGAYNVIAGALSDMIVDQIPPPRPAR